MNEFELLRIRAQGRIAYANNLNCRGDCPYDKKSLLGMIWTYGWYEKWWEETCQKQRKEKI